MSETPPKESVAAKQPQNVLLKSTVLYTITSFLSKGIVFLMIPIYVRWMSKEEYGDFSNMLSWLTVLSGITFMNMHLFIMNRYEKDRRSNYKNLLGGYVATLLVDAALLVPVLIFREQVAMFTRLAPYQMILIGLYLVTTPMFVNYSGYLRADYQLKKYVGVNLLSAFSTALLSVLFLMGSSPSQRLQAFSLGQVLPFMGLGFFFLLVVVLKKTPLNKNAVKSSLSFGLAMIPHLIGIMVISKIDRIMIMQMVGPAATAEYALANNVALILTTFSAALSTAMVPWMIKQIKAGNLRSACKPFANQLVLLMGAVVVISLAAPELIRIWAGAQYEPVILIIAPLLFGVVMTHTYTLIYNVEMVYDKKATLIYSSLLAAGFNILTNYLFIPMFGYQAAAYTTMASNALLMVMHLRTVVAMKKQAAIPIRLIFQVMGASVLLLYPIRFLYRFFWFRWMLVVALGLGGCYFLWTRRDKLFKRQNKDDSALTLSQ
ncbi:hypothetical protein ABB02_00834 [Clostridiaceae bacterium JG1575]|nr:hypothetical protein ABB02_00834 [Clostridiaceae bacterium JG1575]